MIEFRPMKYLDSQIKRNYFIFTDYIYKNTYEL